MKDKFVYSEIRAELMGHKGKGETEGRYGDRYNLRARLAAIEKIPIVTSHLRAQEIRLLPPIANKQRMRVARTRKNRDA
jgi:hypothetical protein